jgi:hypothetical protein
LHVADDVLVEEEGTPGEEVPEEEERESAGIRTQHQVRIPLHGENKNACTCKKY